MAHDHPDVRIDSNPVAAAIRAADGAAKLARLIGVSRWAPHQWQRIPAERVAIVSQVTGIPRHQLRPDLYEAPAEISA